MPDPHAGAPYISRRLTRYDSKGNLEEISDQILRERVPPLVILGDPGMGKTFLLKELERQTQGQFVRAGTFVANPARFRRTSPSDVLIIDALDEVSALREGDPLFNVLTGLASIDYPQFVLSCRAADWRGASARIDISDHYTRPPEQWTLQPISRADASIFLVHSGTEIARASLLLDRLDEKGLSELYGNPLTLSLLRQLALQDDEPIPSSKTALFERAVDILRTEHNEAKQKSSLAKLSRQDALDAAGAVIDPPPLKWSALM